MRVAVACSGLDVAKCFDQAECLTCYSIDKGIIVGCQTLPLLKLPPVEVAELFKVLDIHVLICGKISATDLRLFVDRGVQVVFDQEGTASDAAAAFVSQELSGSEADMEED